MPVPVTVRAVSAYGVARCFSCGHFLPSRRATEVTCTSCGVTIRVEI